MVQALKHRGPDDSGIYHDAESRVAIGQTRLSIIDLSSAGHQPMSYGNERFWIVFNGEIYNYLELKVDLEQAGHRFRSTSDTEVVLAAYAEWGTRAIRRFRGMFAFAIYDRTPTSSAPSVVLARDRLGIKPLLYAEKEGALAFASELRALIAGGFVAKRVDPEAMLDYFAVGAVFQPRTIFADVQALPPGCWMEILGNAHRIVRYWDLNEATTDLRQELKNISFKEAVEQVRHRLIDAARYCMVSDVPVGAFLSGGIDSTIVVGLMGETSGQRIRTYTIGFEETNRDIDERHYAQLAARQLNTDHKEIAITAAEAEYIFPEIWESIDQPSLDGANTWLVSRLARASVKVVVSGLGGDELFVGYQHFRWIADAARNSPSGWPAGLAVVQALHAILPNRFSQRLLYRYANPAGRFALLRRISGNAALLRDILPAWSVDASRRLTQRQEVFLCDDVDSIQQVGYAEMRGYLLSTLLRDGDVMSMAHGLEVRPLLLDHPLVEFVYALPAKHKLRGYKELLVHAVPEYLSDVLRNRPKMGFEMPFVRWMAGPLREKMRSLLCSPAAGRLFRQEYLERLQMQVAKGSPPRELWAWAILLAWCERYQVELPYECGP